MTMNSETNLAAGLQLPEQSSWMVAVDAFLEQQDPVEFGAVPGSVVLKAPLFEGTDDERYLGHSGGWVFARERPGAVLKVWAEPAGG